MKILKNPITLVGILILTVSLFIVACKKQVILGTNPTGSKQLSVYLTDNPCQFDSVFIDIRYAEVKIDTNKNHINDDHYGDNDDDKSNDNLHNDQYGIWDTLTVNPGVYNVLRLRNGIDTLLATGKLREGKVRKIRLTLGTNNSLISGGVSSPLNLFPGTNNYVYVKIHQQDQDDEDEVHSAIWIDFSVCESIIRSRGQYYLKPFLKVFAMKQFGIIEGNVFPPDALPLVRVFNANDSALALPENDGEYKIRGLQEGTYSISIRGSNGYKGKDITNIEVQKGKETHIPDITLIK